MIDQRLDLLTDWLSYFFDDENFVITSASDDASFRRYFRVERNNNTKSLSVVKPDSLIFKWQARALSKAKSRVMPERI
jgi:hypothetical protein